MLALRHRDYVQILAQDSLTPKKLTTTLEVPCRVFSCALSRRGYGPAQPAAHNEFLMSQTRFDVLTIGNAIVDVITRVDDDFLRQEGLDKGIMHLIDEERAEYLYGRMMGEKQQVGGGSNANTAVGVASLGGRAAFVGKVKNDELGDVFGADIRKAGVHFETSSLENGPATARCMILVTDDHERTLNTYLGAAQELRESDIAEDTIGAADVTFMEGYLWDPPEAKKAFVRAAHYAHKHERAAAITLSDPFCVDRYREEFLDLMKSQTVDYVFANVEELKSLYLTGSFEEAVRRIAQDTELAAITMGEDGAMAIHNGEITTVPAHPTEVQDVTGAGDLFAAGFLLAHARGKDIHHSLRLGCLAAAEAISHIGARPRVSLAEYAKSNGLAI
jgi:sugar/nucleoside kinase (ribokinase family)